MIGEAESAVTVVGHHKQSPWRSIRARLLVNGAPVPETPLTGFSVTSTRYSRADTCSLTLAVDRAALAKAKKRWFDPDAPAKGGTPPDINVVVQVRDEEIPNAAWNTQFTGIVSSVRWTPTQTALSVECRDAMAKLMDLRVRRAWMNQTGAEVIQSVADAAGLQADVTFPKAMTGQFWQVEHKRSSASRHSRFQTAYDLARFIADEFECDFYADGNTVICTPRRSPSDQGSIVHTLHYHDPGADAAIETQALSLDLERNFITARNVSVHVMSWDSRQRTRAETYFSAEGHSRTLAENAGTLYNFRYPGLRQDQIERIAEVRYHEIIAHDRRITFDTPGRIGLAARQFMVVSGTGSSWDVSKENAYAVDAVTTTYTKDGSYLQNVTLRNRIASEGSNNAQ